VIYPFDQVDLSKYLTQEQVEEIRNKLGFDPLQNNQSVQTQSVQDLATQNKNTQNVQNTQKQNVQNTQDQNVSKQRIDYKITIDEFWEEDNLAVIHCDEEWKADILMKVFDRMGKVWDSGEDYTQDNRFESHKSNTCYSNSNSCGSYQAYEECYDCQIIDFSKVDLSKYLTLEEAMVIIGMSGILRKYLKSEDIKEMLDSLGCGHLLTDDMSM
jgi:hypothetical protein